MSKETILDITVIPKSSRSEIKTEDGSIRAYLNSPPVDGKANAELIKLLSKKLRIAKNRIEIIMGEKGRKKRVSIEGMLKEEIMNILKQTA